MFMTHPFPDNEGLLIGSIPSSVVHIRKAKTGFAIGQVYETGRTEETSIILADFV
jgi:hypothetical protein